MENQLTITDKNAINQLPIALQKYALAKEGEIVSKMTLKFAIKSIYEVIAKTLIDTGVKNIPEQQQVILNISETVYTLICDKYKNLTINELRLACFNGSLEEYGKYFGVNLKTVSDWLKGYNNDENKKKAMHEWNKMIDLVTIKKFNDQQKEEIILDGCIKCFEEYKTSGILKQLIKPCDSLLAIFYDKLKEKQLLVFTKDVKLEIYDLAEKEYKETLEAAKKDRKIKFEQKDMDVLIQSMAENKNKPFANICKRMSLLRYFDGLIEMDHNLKTLIYTQNENAN